MQTVQVKLLAGEVQNGAERLQQYGFTGVPSAGAEAIIVCIGAARNLATVIAVDDSRFRPTDMVDGEVAIYSKFNSRVTLKADGSIQLLPAAGKSVVVTGDLQVSGDTTVDGAVNVGSDLVAAGNVQDATGTMQAMRDTYNVHTHNEHDGPVTTTPSVEMT